METYHNKWTEKVDSGSSLKASWLTEALRLRSEGLPVAESLERLENLIRQDLKGEESVRKTLRTLRRIWLEPYRGFKAIQDEGIRIFRTDPTTGTALVLSFATVSAMYPFFREVTEACGRLLRLQGSAKIEQVKRKLASVYGERELTSRSTRYSLALLVDFGVLKSSGKLGVYTAGTMDISGPFLTAFALISLFQSIGDEGGLRRSDIEQHPALFFCDTFHLIEAAIEDSRFLVSREALDREVISVSTS